MRLVILDRDGVINKETGHHVRSPDEWQLLPGSLEAIANLSKANYRIVIATNQSGIGRGLLDTNTLNKIHNRMLDELHKKGGAIDGIFYCPHHPEDNCECRKPKPGLLKEIAERLRVNLSGVLFVGDSIRDLQAARAANAQPVLVLSGKNEMKLEPSDKIQQDEFKDVPVFKDLNAFSQALIANELN